MALGSQRLATGKCQFGVGNWVWRLGVGNLSLSNCMQAIGCWQLITKQEDYLISVLVHTANIHSHLTGACAHDGFSPFLSCY